MLSITPTGKWFYFVEGPDSANFCLLSVLAVGHLLLESGSTSSTCCTAIIARLASLTTSSAFPSPKSWQAPRSASLHRDNATPPPPQDFHHAPDGVACAPKLQTLTPKCSHVTPLISYITKKIVLLEKDCSELARRCEHFREQVTQILARKCTCDTGHAHKPAQAAVHVHAYSGLECFGCCRRVAPDARMRPLQV